MMDTGLHCLKLIGAFHQVAVDDAILKHKFSDELIISENGEPIFNTKSLLLAAKSLGLNAKCIRQKADRLDKAPYPAIAQHPDGRYFIVARVEPAKFESGKKEGPFLLIQHAGKPPELIKISEFENHWNGEFIFFSSKISLAAGLAKFDFTWFVPSLVKYRWVLAEVVLISLILQIIALTTPLFFQVVMDKVLVNRATQTLTVIAIGLVVAHIFEALLTGVRTWAFSHTSSKIDVELGAQLFRHLLNLPISYFQARRVGDSVARMRELENIRSFLTGNALSVLLDIAFSVVFVMVMLTYSRTLTMIVLGSIPCYFALSLLFTPLIRRKLDEKFNRSAENQSFLVETMNGIDVVKALAVEPRWAYKWDQQLAAYVVASLDATNISALAGLGVNLIGKLVTVGIMWMGADLVIRNEMTLGALIAFNMLASQVSSPILRLAQLWNDFQQVGISMSRMGDILNARPEVIGDRSRLPQIEGDIEFDKVTFRYRPETNDVLRNVSLNFKAGEVIGIVGRSGSGKSTLTKLMQRLYLPVAGRVMIDGHDLSTIDTASLRRQIGVVLQENTLFNRSVRANIALVDPGVPLEIIISAAKLAGAHDFICELPEGYDTIVGEHGVGLSGGQRQRIAIARALMGNPRILILDEATSALDYESESAIQANMQSICRGRTVVIIAHRLSTLRDADRIIVMDRGQVVESGTHEELLQTPAGIYSHLYALQQGLTNAK